MPILQAEPVEEFRFIFPSWQEKIDKGEIAEREALQVSGLDWLPYPAVARIASTAVYGEPGNRYVQEDALPLDESMINLYAMLQWLTQPSTSWNATDARGNELPRNRQTLETPGLFDQNDIAALARACGTRFFWGLRMSADELNALLKPGAARNGSKPTRVSGKARRPKKSPTTSTEIASSQTPEPFPQTAEATGS